MRTCAPADGFESPVLLPANYGASACLARCNMASLSGMQSFCLSAALVVTLFVNVSGAPPDLGTRDLASPNIPMKAAFSGSHEPDPRERTFSPVNILNLPHSTCRYDSRRKGTCMQGSECAAAGGKSKADSACNPARGAYLGMCCLLEQTCGGLIWKNNTHFVNPDFPADTTTPQTCDVAVASFLMSPKVCYLRLSMKNFTIHDPMNGVCKVDQFFAPQIEVPSVPRLCGYNNDSHMYLYVKDIAKQQNITLRFNLGEWNGPRHWMVRVTAIDCGEEWTPPSRSCLQYNLSSNETIRSFNYHESEPEKSAMLAGLRYTVCIRQEPTKCYTKWTSEYFSMSSSNKTSALGDACQDNYVVINQGFNYGKQNMTHDRYCGEVLGSQSNSTNSSAIYSAALPFNIQVRHSDNHKLLGKGFSLQYKQLQCGQARSGEGLFSWIASFLPNYSRQNSDALPPNSTLAVSESEPPAETPDS